MQPPPTDLTQLAQSIPQVFQSHFDMVERAVLALPFATALGSALAFRPRRRGTPARSAPVIETQIVLAVVGATVMLVVGSSLARAFGIVGAANLIRYRAKIDDPKDAVVMLATLSMGLCCGVELYGLAAFTTLFLLGLLWALESIEPESTKHFELKVTAADPAALRGDVEAILKRYKVTYELRSVGQKELCYDSELPLRTPTDRIANAILALGKSGETEVAWDERKAKK
jgi:uncharacterized membrane protein YhiD involved in acid resistance